MIVAIIPAYNEEANISEVIQQTKMHVDEVIVCDDGSMDNTYKIAEAAGATVVRHHRNMGYGATLSTLFKEARKLNPDVTVTLDADGQHNPGYIPKLIEPILANSTDVVIGSRFISEEGKEALPAYRKVGIRLVTRLTKMASYIGMTDAQSGFRAYSRKALQEIQPSERGMGASTEILIKAKQAKLTIKEMPMTMKYEGITSKENPVVQLFKVVLSTLKFLSMRRPQIFFGGPSIAALVIALGFWIQADVVQITMSPTTVETTLVATGITMIGVVLATVAIIMWTIVITAKEITAEKEGRTT